MGRDSPSQAVPGERYPLPESFGLYRGGAGACPVAPFSSRRPAKVTANRLSSRGAFLKISCAAVALLASCDAGDTQTEMVAALYKALLP